MIFYSDKSVATGDFFLLLDMFPYSKTITSCLIFLEAFLVITNLGSGNDADSAFFCYSSGKFTSG